jgi:hypothetical protein
VEQASGRLRTHVTQTHMTHNLAAESLLRGTDPDPNQLGPVAGEWTAARVGTLEPVVSQ